MSKVPKCWPNDVEYISDFVWSKHVSNEILKECGVNYNVSLMNHKNNINKNSNKLIRIKIINDIKHPAYKQRGLFALKKIKNKTYICDYIGYIETTEYESLTSDYIMFFYKNLSCDACKMGNESRFMNDYRNISDKPNCEWKNYRDIHGRLRIGVFASKDIKKGDELLVTYGKAFWKSRKNNNNKSNNNTTK